MPYHGLTNSVSWIFWKIKKTKKWLDFFYLVQYDTSYKVDAFFCGMTLEELEWSAPWSTCVTCRRLVRFFFIIDRKTKFQSYPMNWKKYLFETWRKSVTKNSDEKVWHEKVWRKSLTDRQTTDKKKVIPKCHLC